MCPLAQLYARLISSVHSIFYLALSCFGYSARDLGVYLLIRTLLFLLLLLFLLAIDLFPFWINFNPDKAEHTISPGRRALDSGQAFANDRIDLIIIITVPGAFVASVARCLTSAHSMMVLRMCPLMIHCPRIGFCFSAVNSGSGEKSRPSVPQQQINILSVATSQAGMR